MGSFRLIDRSEAFGYNADELNAVPKGSHMGLSCGNPVAMASLKEVRRSLGNPLAVTGQLSRTQFHLTLTRGRPSSTSAPVEASIASSLARRSDLPEGYAPLLYPIQSYFSRRK